MQNHAQISHAISFLQFLVQFFAVVHKFLVHKKLQNFRICKKNQMEEHKRKKGKNHIQKSNYLDIWGWGWSGCINPDIKKNLEGLTLK